MGFLDKLNPVSAIADAATSIIGSFKLAPAQQVKAEEAIRKAALEAMRLQQEREAALIKEQGAVIRAETQSGSWLASNWRPIVMLTLTSMVVMYWMGWSQPNLPSERVGDLLQIVRWGLSGYVVGRSGEKIAQTVMTGLSNRKGGQ